MSNVSDIKISVIFKKNAYVLNLNMRSFLKYEEITGHGLSLDIFNFYNGKIKETIDFLKCTLRYDNRFYADSDEEMILSSKDFEKICKTDRDKMQIVLALTGFIRSIILKNFFEDEDEDDENNEDVKKK